VENEDDDRQSHKIEFFSLGAIFILVIRSVSVTANPDSLDKIPTYVGELRVTWDMSTNKREKKFFT